MDGWKMTIPIGARPIFRGENVSFWEGNLTANFTPTKRIPNLQPLIPLQETADSL